MYLHHAFPCRTPEAFTVRHERSSSVRNMAGYCPEQMLLCRRDNDHYAAPLDKLSTLHTQTIGVIVPKSRLSPSNRILTVYLYPDSHLVLLYTKDGHSPFYPQTIFSDRGSGLSGIPGIYEGSRYQFYFRAEEVSAPSVPLNMLWNRLVAGRSGRTVAGQFLSFLLPFL